MLFYKRVFALLLCVQTTHPFTYIHSIETLNVLKEVMLNKKKGALLRFGDGDLALAYGVRSGTHEISLELQNEMMQAFGMNDPYILKTLPLLCPEHGGAEAKMFYVDQEMNENNCIEVRDKAQKIWGEEIEVLYSPVALAYTAVFEPALCRDFLIFLREQNCELFVGNEDISYSMIELLFGKCKRVNTPARSAYEKIDIIEQNCLQNISAQSDTYRVAIISCGNTGRVLIKRLWPQIENIFFFDMGSLMDALCGWPIRQWMRRERFDHESFLNPLIQYWQVRS